MVHNNMPLERFVHVVYMLRKRFKAAADFTVNGHFTSGNACIVWPFFLSVNGDPYKPIWLPVWHFVFIGKKFNPFFSRTAGMHRPDINDGFSGFYINDNG